MLLALRGLASGCAFDTAPAQPEACVSASSAALVGGQPSPASLALAPAQRDAIVRIERAGELVCTGTRIGPSWAITAAHCVSGDQVELRLSGAGGPARTACTVRRHGELDVALLGLPSDSADRCAATIPLWPAGIDASWLGRPVTLAGHGLTQRGASEGLRFADELVVHADATELWVDGGGDSGACHGDSGGPLLVSDATGAVHVAGVLTRGAADCTSLDAYVHAAALRGWALATLTGPACADPRP